MNQDRSVGWSGSLVWEEDIFVDRKPQSPPASKQCGWKTSAIPDCHGLVMMIFVTDRRDRVPAGIKIGVKSMARRVFVI